MPPIFPFTGLFDSHCHLTSPGLQESIVEIVKSSLNAGVKHIIDVAIDLDTAVDALAHAEKFPGIILPTVGIDPEICVPGSDIYRADYDYTKIDKQIEKMRFLLQTEKYSMIGECGMDLYWLHQQKLPADQVAKSFELQKYLLIKQLELAAEFKLPLTIHQRDCFKEIMEIFLPFKGSIKGVFHSFTGTYEQALQIFDLGFAIGINGIITYKSADALREVLTKLKGGKKIAAPADLYAFGIYLETDAPYLIPRGFKGKVNAPAGIQDIWEFILKKLNRFE